MGDRGRTPASELALASDNSAKFERPVPPEHLTPEQKVIWKATVDAMPPDWFRPETLEVLAQYCRHVVQARHVAEMIEEMEGSADKFDIREYGMLLRCQSNETEKIASTATKLRITLQSTYDKSKKKGNTSKRAWE